MEDRVNETMFRVALSCNSSLVVMRRQHENGESDPDILTGTPHLSSPFKGEQDGRDREM